MKFTFSSLLLCGLLFLSSITAQAQFPGIGGGNTAVKLNLSSLAVKNINLNVEQAIGGKASVNLGFNILPGTTIPFLDQIDGLDFDNNDRPQVKGFGVVPELRIYVGKKGALNGFYIAPYGNISRYSLPESGYTISTLDFDFNGQNYAVAPFSVTATDGKIGLLGVGGMIGAQWMINDRVVIDWGIGGLGVNLATISGRLGVSDIAVPAALTDEVSVTVQDVIDQALTDIQSEIVNFDEFDFGSFNTDFVEKIAGDILDTKVRVGVPDVRFNIQIGIAL